MKMQSAVLALVLSALASGAMAELGLGIGAYKKENFVTAMKELNGPAQQGNTISQLLIGLMYRDGQGVAQNDATALKWFQKAAASGNADAMEEIATAYAVGAGVPANISTAFDWLIKSGVIKGYSSFGQPPKHRAVFEKGTKENAEYEKNLKAYEADIRTKAERGDVDAQVRLGYLYVTFTASTVGGVDSDMTQAEGWWLKAAEKSDVRAQGLLGSVYLVGMVVDRDKKKAEKWFLEAARKGDANAQLKLARLYGFASELKYNPSVDIPLNPSAAIEWAEKAVAQGLPSAQTTLGILLSKRGASDNDVSRAVKLLTKNSELGEMEATLMLGDMYSEGVGVTQDFGKAITLYQKPFIPDKYSNARVARMYELGLGVPKDKIRAIQLYELAGKQTAEVFLYKKLAALYESAPSPDPKKAFWNFLNAATMGDVESMKRLEVAYLKGELGETIDKSKAKATLNKSPVDR